LKLKLVDCSRIDVPWSLPCQDSGASGFKSPPAGRPGAVETARATLERPQLQVPNRPSWRRSASWVPCHVSPRAYLTYWKMPSEVSASADRHASHGTGQSSPAHDFGRFDVEQLEATHRISDLVISVDTGLFLWSAVEGLGLGHWGFPADSDGARSRI
jgi:hypothetical protein